MDDDSALRVSDEQRERVAQEIREHYAAGRLSEDELSERLAAAYRAQTAAQLRTLHADLPALPATPAQRRAELAERRAELQRRLLQQSGGALVPFVFCTVIWLTSGGHHGHGQFWPIWVLLLVLIPLLQNGWRLYGPAPELERVEQELARREHKRAIRDRAEHRAYERAEHRARRYGDGP
ncbi:MAG: hypothetical protein DLM64_03815 [Solirubrobacterales bacterium]|nr:MAG: hypothetical protein DLM64_03815 [Solirubrobacterales bacterium]